MRALLLVLDSVGIGHAPDAGEYGNTGANTLGHVLERSPQLQLPNLRTLGLDQVLDRERKQSLPPVRASYGRMRERSAGKDTTTGHWEIAGAILAEPFATFTKFPDSLVHAIQREGGVQFIGNCARSGTAILEELGPEHLRTGHPILYTSADSVMQIAAHEDVLETAQLYRICHVARKLCDPFRIGRVIARPFAGQPGNFYRTNRRHDYSMRPPPTVLNALANAGVSVIGIGKISDIFAGSGISESHPTSSNAEGMRAIEQLWDKSRNGLLFANLVDFDMLWGHRRDVAGYARALAQFDDWLGTFLPRVGPEDLVIITADHGNDPTFRGTDHTREEVPLFIMDGAVPCDLGTRESFAEVAVTLADFFRIGWRVPKL